MTVHTSSRRLLFGPYDRILLNGLHRLALIVCLGLYIVVIWLFIHSVWIERPWDHQPVLLRTFAFAVRPSADPGLLRTARAGIALAIVATGVVLVSAALMGRHKRLFYQLLPVWCGLLCLSQIANMTARTVMDMRFTATGVWSGGSFVRWSDVEHYRWQSITAYDRQQHWPLEAPGPYVLTLLMQPAFLEPRTWQWTISKSDAPDVQRLLVGFLPGRQATARGG